MAKFDAKKKLPTKEEMTKSDTITASYDNHIRPLLDAVDRLRHLKVMQEGIQLPTIVVVGDQSSGKSSVLESLAGISLPRGQGICTRVPLVMRLQNDPSVVEPRLVLEYRDKNVPTTEAGITAAIRTATDEIAGNGKGISDTPLTLVVKKKGVPDLTMVDLPGITRVPVHGQPDNIYEQISSIIMEYIAPKESIILNVLSATVDFPTCESIRMSQQVDRNGERTLAVVTKADKAPEGLLEKVTADDVNIGLGYVCVRNRVGDESYEQARAEESCLFETHPLLSKIDKSIVGIPVLAQRLMQIQASSISKCLPNIVQKINDKLSRNVSDLNDMPQNLSTIADAVRVFIQILKHVRDSLEKILIRGEFDEFPDDLELHGTARLAEMLHKYSTSLPSKCPFNDELFLMEEIQILEEMNGIRLPNFLPRSAFLTILRKKVDKISEMPRELVEDVWCYVEGVATQMLLKHSRNYPQIQSSIRSAVHNLIEKMRTTSMKFVKEMIAMELVADYTANPDYMKTWTGLMEDQKVFMEAIKNHGLPTTLKLKVFGEIEVRHLRQSAELAEQAFDMRMRMSAYWRTIVLRMVDGPALHLLYSIKCLVESEMETELVNQLVGPRMTGLERMLEESPLAAGKRERLQKSILLLKQSKDVVANLMDRIAID
ncbi:dynamin-related protein 4C-like [Typha latifolia]|uniref:dynamin-related protein 4C-like n=1 Tax=Typha latifolia TaxID=4733 RepID=UPI003C2AC414